jgi:hypothetical protein
MGEGGRGLPNSEINDLVSKTMKEHFFKVKRTTLLAPPVLLD